MLVRKLSLAVNLAIAVMVAAAWIGMMFALDRNQTLAARGLWSLKYFTVLSNLLAGAAALVYAACLIRLLAGRAGAVPRWVILVKYAGAASVALTLATVVLFLGPTAKTGFLSMFQGANLWFHLVVPLLCVVDFCWLNPDGPLAASDGLVACLPMALYAVGYTLNLALNGFVGKDGRVNDWYRFAFGGWGTAILAALITFGATWGMAQLMRLARR